VFFFGNDNTQTNGVPLPFDLTPFGATGCSLYTDIDAVLVGSTTWQHPGTAVMNAVLPVPRNFALLGARLFTQAAVLDPTANSLGLRMTQAHEVHLHTPPGTWLGLLLAGSWEGQPPTSLTNHFLVMKLK